VSLASLREEMDEEDRGCYTSSLERTLDLVHVLNKLTVEFLDEIPNLMVIVKSKHVHQPHLSLSSLNRMIWERIKACQQNLLCKGLKTNEPGLCMTSSEIMVQTDLSEMSYCECCRMSHQLVREFLKEVEDLCNKLKLPRCCVRESRCGPGQNEIETLGTVPMGCDERMVRSYRK